MEAADKLCPELTEIHSSNATHFVASCVLASHDVIVA